MTPIRYVFSHCTLDSIRLLFGNAGIVCPDVDNATHRTRLAALIRAVEAASDASRNRIEVVTGQVEALAKKADFAELALRAVCEDAPDQRAALEKDRSLTERALLVLLTAPKLFDRARNVASGLHWRDGRYHRGFWASPPGIPIDPSTAVEKIADAIQERQGGRRVQHEVFAYRPIGDSDGDRPAIQHIAVYVEAPAASGMEFAEGEDEVAQVVRRPAKELAIDYDPETGEFHVAGYGVGGSKVLETVAEMYRVHALCGANLVIVQPREARLDAFKEPASLDLAPPKGISSCRVYAIRLRSMNADAGHAEFVAGEAQNAYDRMAELGVDVDQLAGEFVRAITVEFLCADGEDGRRFKATLTWPGSLTFDGASVEDRRVAERFFVDRGFLDPVGQER